MSLSNLWLSHFLKTETAQLDLTLPVLAGKLRGGGRKRAGGQKVRSPAERGWEAGEERLGSGIPKVA